MKHTIKLSAIKAIVVQPSPTGPGVEFSITMLGATVGMFILSNSIARLVCRHIEAANHRCEESNEIYLEDGRCIDIGPTELRPGVEISLKGLGCIDLTPDQCGVLILGIECAINPVVAAKQAAKGVRCHGDACCGGQLPCPTKAACGVAA